MTFLELYGTQLDTQLASADRSQLFTTALRKQAINDAVRAFIRETNCTKRYGGISIIDETGEYDIENNLSDFIKLAEPPSIRIVKSGQTRYIQGRTDFPETTPDRLDWENPSWRATDPGTPTAWYIRVDGGTRYLGCWPPPDVGVGETWTWVVPYVARPDTMTVDGDTPFSFNSNTMSILEDYHQALVHYAAAQLEPLRKNYDGVKYQMGLFTSFVNRYKGASAQDLPIQMARTYFVNRTGAEDPRR